MREDFLTRYFAVWGWMILSMIFLVGGLVVYALPNDNITGAIYVALVVSSLGCIAMVLKRKKEIVNETEE